MGKIYRKTGKWGIIFFFTALMAAIPVSAAEKREIVVEADAYIRDNDTQNGTGNVIEVKKDANGYNRNALFRFQLPDDLQISEYNKVNFRFYLETTDGAAVRQVEFYRVEDN